MPSRIYAYLKQLSDSDLEDAVSEALATPFPEQLRVDGPVSDLARKAMEHFGLVDSATWTRCMHSAVQIAAAQRWLEESRKAARERGMR